MTAAAVPKSPAEAVQLAALEALIAIASGPDAATLGSGWPSVLRTLSNLHTLQVQIPCHDKEPQCHTSSVRVLARRGLVQGHSNVMCNLSMRIVQILLKHCARTTFSRHDDKHDTVSLLSMLSIYFHSCECQWLDGNFGMATRLMLPNACSLLEGGNRDLLYPTS